jgi:signal transduction histidine kinase
MKSRFVPAAETIEDSLRTLVPRTPLSLFAFDNSGVITLSQGTILEDLGLRPGPVVGQSMFDFNLRTPSLMTGIRRALAGESVNFVTNVDDFVFEVHFIPVQDANGKIGGVTGVAHNVTEQRRAESLLAGEKRLLEMVAAGGSLTEVLEAICVLVEETTNDCYCSVVLVDPSGSHLEQGVAPSLPRSFIRSIIGRPVNVNSGPCAMAAYLNQQVIAADLTSETRWAEYEWCPMALSHGLHACWSTPISSTAGKVVGAFTLYYDAPRTPTPLHQRLIHQFTDIASIAIERTRAEEALRASEQVARGQVEALVESLDVLSTAPAPDQFLLRMLSTIGRLLGEPCLGVALWRVDETDALSLRAAIKGKGCDPVGSAHPFAKDSCSWKEDVGLQELFFTGGPIPYDNVETDPRIPSRVRSFFRSRRIRKILRLPTLVGGQVKGFITLCHGLRPPYQPAEIELAQALAHQAMLAIQTGQAAILEERNRMARDIHDTLAQGFTAIVVQLQAAADATDKGLTKDAGKHLQSAHDIARQSLAEARRSVRALRPQALEKTSFWDALKGMIKQSTAGTVLRTKCQMRGHPRKLPPLWQQNLLHIGQEALTNTLKYARARRFDARLSFNKTELRLEFEDDGEGFVKTDQHDGFGLIGMRERVEQMRGTLTVKSARNAGTKVVVVSRYANGDLL